MSMLMQRRRAMMARKTDGPNGLVPAAAVGRGTCVGSVTNDGFLEISVWNSGGGLRPYFKRPITIHNGDTVNIKIVRQTTASLSNRYSYCNIDIGQVRVVDNKLYTGNTNIAINQTVTVTQDITADYLSLVQRTANITATNYIVEIQISVNGNRVI